VTRKIKKWRETKGTSQQASSPNGTPFYITLQAKKRGERQSERGRKYVPSCRGKDFEAKEEKEELNRKSVKIGRLQTVTFRENAKGGKKKMLTGEHSGHPLCKGQRRRLSKKAERLKPRSKKDSSKYSSTTN